MVILIVDDEPSQRTTLNELLKEKHDTHVCEDGAQALTFLEKNAVDLVITDYQMPQLSGLELIKRGKAVSPGSSFVLMTAYGSVDHAVEAIRAGADDYLMKPCELDEIEHRVDRIEQLRLFKNHTELKSHVENPNRRLVGKSPAVANAMKFVDSVAKARAPVLLLGQTGTGKEVLARLIHEAGAGSGRNFVAVNCASLSQELMESELFGHEKGAFTGAVAAKPGKFELASGGTIFLDEVGELSLPLQAKLLRTLQEREFSRVGGVRVIKSDARVIAATHRPLKQMVQDKTFREDLYFRLNILTFELAPLAQRREDIPLLIEYFIEKFTREMGHRLRLASATRDLLLAHDYPGNIRELQNVLERLAVLGGGNAEVGPELLPEEFRRGGNREAASPRPAANAESELGTRGLTEIIEAHERRLIRDALSRSHNNQARAAELLRIPRGTLQYKIKRYGLSETGADSEDEAA